MMVVSETSGKDSSRRGSSASPIRERLKRKPRQDWLVTVGQGRSPARTLRRESKGRATSRSPGRSKKFDSARLSFGGLEQDPKTHRSRSPPQADDGTPSSPATPESRSRKQRPGLSPSSAGSLKGRSLTSPMLLASVTSAATAPPTAASPTDKRRSPAFPRSAAGVDSDRTGSPFGRSVELRPPSPSSTPVSPSTAAAVPKTDWLAAAISGGRGESGGEEAVSAQTTTTTTTIAEGKFHSTGGMKVAAEERNAKLSSLLLLSPGKEYWADRLAAKGPRDSGSPRSLTRSKARHSAFGWGGEDVSSSPPARGQNDAPSYTDRGQQHQEGANGGPTSAGSPRKKDFRSFTAVKKVAPLSPVGGGGTSPSAWSTQAFASPGGGGGAERRARLDVSPWRARKPGQGLSPRRQASPSSSPRSLAKGDWRRGPAGVRPSQAGASRSLSPLAGGRAAGFGKTSSVRFGRGKDPPGAGFGAGSRGASSSMRQVSQEEPASPLLSLIGGNSSSSSSSSGGRRPRATPSTLPSVNSGGGSGCGDATAVVAQDADGHEQATTAPPLCEDKLEEAVDEASGHGGITAGDGGASTAAAVVQMPESCGAEKEEASADADDDRANGKAEGGALFAERKEASGEGRAEGGACDGTAGLLTVETKDFGETSGCTAVFHNPAGAEHDDPLRPTLVVTSRPSPLRAQLQSPITQDPSPCTSDGLHFAVSDVIPPDGGPEGNEAEQLPPSPQATAAVVREDARPPLHGNGGGFKGHVPPGVRIVGRTAAGDQHGAASGGGSDGGGGGGALAGEAPAGRRDRTTSSSSPSSVCSEGGGTGPPRGGEVKLFVSTPTGEGDASDLSLWVTTRGSEEGGGEGAATSGDAAASPLPSPPSVRLSPAAVNSLEDDDPGIDAGDGASTAVDLEEEDLEKDFRNGLGFGAQNALETRSDDGEGGVSGEVENEAEVLLEEEGATRCLLQPSERPEVAEEAGGDNEDPETAVSQGEVENAAEGLSGADAPLLDSSKKIPLTTAKTAANVEKTEVGGMEGPWEAVARVFCGIFNFCRPPGGEGRQGGKR